jgi:hypothetical protein
MNERRRLKGPALFLGSEANDGGSRGDLKGLQNDVEDIVRLENLQLSMSRKRGYLSV